MNSEDLFVPTLKTFENNNVFTGSLGLFRYKITPIIVMATPKEVDLEQSTIRAEYWHGLYSYENSQIEEERVFSIQPEGYQEMLRWLKEHI